LVFVSFPKVSDTEFVSILDQVHPGAIVELRKVPRFDFGRLNRRTAFEYFRRNGSRYVDLIADATEQDDQLVEKVREILSDRSARVSPLMFLVSGNDHLSSLTGTILNCLKVSGEQWNICYLPHHGQNVSFDSRDGAMPQGAATNVWDLPNRGLSLCIPSQPVFATVNFDSVRGRDPKQPSTESSFPPISHYVTLVRIAATQAKPLSFLPWEEEYLDEDYARMLYDRTQLAAVRAWPRY